jgi:poly-gamma-glutamate synthesis protein (capsule biosynthesis protein)
VIASCHWGIEGDHYPNDYQQTLAHKIVDWGADLVVGTHPHVLQGVEEYNGKIILYSLGNFCFGGNRNPTDKDTAIYQQTFTFVDGVLQEDISADIVPCKISSTDSVNDFQPTVATGDRKQSIIEKMNEYSKSYSDISFDDDGKLIIRSQEND